MYKKDLAKLPFQKPDPEELKIHGRIMKAEKHLTTQGEVLVLSITSATYQGSNRMTWDSRTHRYEPCYLWDTIQMFCTKEKYVSHVHTKDGYRWSDSSPENFGFYFIHKDEESERILTETFQEWGYSGMGGYQEELSRQKRIKQNWKEIDSIRKDMEKFKPLPKGYDRFEKKLLRPHYVLFADKEAGKVKCSYCGHEFDKGPAVKVNKEAICPSCHGKYMVRSTKMSRANMQFIEWSLYLQRTEDGEFLTRYTRHVLDLTGKEPRILRHELERSVISEETTRIYESGDYKKLGVISWRYPLDRYCMYRPNEWVSPEGMTVYNRPADIKKILSDSWLEHAGLELLIKPACYDPYIIERYMNQYRRGIDCEGLLKCGFLRLAMERINGGDCLDTKETSIIRQLGVSKQAYRMLLKEAGNISSAQILTVREFEKRFHRLMADDEWEVLKKLDGSGYHFVPYSAQTYMDIYQKTGVRIPKLARYLRKQNAPISDYADYLSWLQEMKCGLSEFHMFPRSFREAHDRRYKEVLARRDAERRRLEREFNKKLSEAQKRFAEELERSKEYSHAFKTKHYLIRLPNSLDELDTEGEKLHHCVATKKDDVMNKQTQIFFIRRVKEPDKPFYTLEWKDGKLIQCKGYFNSNYEKNPEIKALVNCFVTMMQNNPQLTAASV